MSDLELLMERLTLIQEELLSGSDAVGVPFYAQEATPFWTNSVEFETEWNSLDYYRVTYRVTMTLVLAELTEGYDQQAQQKVNQTVPPTLMYFMQRRFLQSITQQTQLINTDPAGLARISGRTLTGQERSGIGANQVGVEFILEIAFVYRVEQAYF